MPRPISSRCVRLGALRRCVRTLFLRWVASGAVIDEAHDTNLEEGEIAALSAAIDAARRAGR